MNDSAARAHSGLRNVVLALSIVALLGILGMSALGHFSNTGLLFIALWSALAIYAGGSAALKGYAFSAWIFAGVAAAMFYPQAFVYWGSFKLTGLIEPVLMVIMFGMGTTMSLRDFTQVLLMPKGVIVGMTLQFTIMPLVGFALAKTIQFPPDVAAGVILIGCVPSGLASNVMNYIAGSNLALSVTVTALATLCSPILTPMWMKLLAGQFIPIDFLEMMLGVFRITLIPVGAGLLFNKFLHGKAKWLDRSLPVVSMAGILVAVVVITAVGRDQLLTVGLLLLGAEILHNTAGYVLGYWGSRAAGLDEKSCRTVAIEVGLQNGGMASALAINVLKNPSVALAPAIFGPWMNISGSLLANWWHARPVKDDPSVSRVEAVALSD